MAKHNAWLEHMAKTRKAYPKIKDVGKLAKLAKKTYKHKKGQHGGDDEVGVEHADGEMPQGGGKRYKRKRKGGMRGGAAHEDGHEDESATTTTNEGGNGDTTEDTTNSTGGTNMEGSTEETMDTMEGNEDGIDLDKVADQIAQTTGGGRRKKHKKSAKKSKKKSKKHSKKHRKSKKKSSKRRR
jgi:hypothetical protein